MFIRTFALSAMAVSVVAASFAAAATAKAAPPAVPPGPAAVAAALPQCTGYRDIEGAFGWKVRLPAHGSSLDCVLGYGSTGPGVETLQIALIYCNNANLGSSGVDGIYGPRTRDAITWIQAFNGIQVDGIYGPQTRREVYWVYHNGTEGFCVRYPPG